MPAAHPTLVIFSVYIVDSDYGAQAKRKILEGATV